MDTIRRKLMMEAGSEKKVYGNSFNCWRSILLTEGPSALYRGVVANSLRTTGGALIITLYYEFSKYL